MTYCDEHDGGCGASLTATDYSVGFCTQCRKEIKTMAKPIEITYGLAMAAAQDAGNRSMREGRRTKWAVKDWNVACQTFERLYPLPKKSATSNQHHERKGGVSR